MHPLLESMYFSYKRELHYSRELKEREEEGKMANLNPDTTIWIPKSGNSNSLGLPKPREDNSKFLPSQIELVEELRIHDISFPKYQKGASKFGSYTLKSDS